MILDRITSRAAGPDGSPSANGLSRRGFLQAGAAAGGGLMLSLSLPFANGEAEAADADGFAPNAFIRIEGDGRIVLTMPYVEMGQGTYTSIPMLIAEELEVDLNQVQLEHVRPTRSSTEIPCWAAYRERAARPRYARSGSRCAKPARPREPCSCRRRRSAGMSIRHPAARKAVRCFTRRRAEASNTANLPPTLPACPSRKRGAQATGGFQAHRHPSEAPGRAGEGQWNGRLRHRRSAAGREDRDPCAIAGLWRSSEERGRSRGHGHQGRASDRAARRRCRRRGRPYGGCDERTGGPDD